MKPTRLLALLLLIFAPVPARAAMDPAAARQLYAKVTPSLVAVQYIWQSELGRRELVGPGVVVGEEGLVMTPLSLFDLRIPDAQMKEFKIIVPRPGKDPDELDATFEGRDERSSIAFVRAKEKQHWPPIKFEDVPVNVGDDVVSIGVLPKNSAYRSFLAQGTVSATLRGEMPQVMVIHALAGIGAPVFTPDGRAIGLVNLEQDPRVFLNMENPRRPMAPMTDPPVFFIPARDFLQSLSDPPSAEKPMKLPWLGVPQGAMAGLNKDVAESMNLKDQAAIELGDVIEGSPAAKAGLKPGSIVIKMNGQPLERGDDPEALPLILMRKLRRMKVGEKLTLTVVTARDKPPADVKITLDERPPGPHLAERFYAEDLGFSVRQIVFIDTYIRKLPRDARGAIVALIKPQSSAATAKLAPNDLISEMNGKPVADLADFKTGYETLRKTKPREAIVLVVLREGATQTIRIEPPQ
jgi:serine protease Do